MGNRRGIGVHLAGQARKAGAQRILRIEYLSALAPVTWATTTAPVTAHGKPGSSVQTPSSTTVDQAEECQRERLGEADRSGACRKIIRDRHKTGRHGQAPQGHWRSRRPTPNNRRYSARIQAVFSPWRTNITFLAVVCRPSTRDSHHSSSGYCDRPSIARRHYGLPADHDTIGSQCSLCGQSARPSSRSYCGNSNTVRRSDHSAQCDSRYTLLARCDQH